MPADIVMTVKARHIRNMRTGVKKYELRKTRPAKDTPRRVWLCESGSGGRIVASFTCRNFPELSAVHPVKLAKLAAITAAEVEGYRKKGGGKLYGWKIENFEDYKGTEWELHIADFGLTRPPQSWCYAKEVDPYE